MKPATKAPLTREEFEAIQKAFDAAEKVELPEYDCDDEVEFQCCDDCDLPDACEDFGCAIKKGMRTRQDW